MKLEVERRTTQQGDPIVSVTAYLSDNCLGFDILEECFPHDKYLSVAIEQLKKAIAKRDESVDCAHITPKYIKSLLA